jgi:hypothetical protein
MPELLAQALRLLGQQQELIESLTEEIARQRARQEVLGALVERVLTLAPLGPSPRPVPAVFETESAIMHYVHRPIVPVPCRLCATPFTPGAGLRTLCKACKSAVMGGNAAKARQRKTRPIPLEAAHA